MLSPVPSNAQKAQWNGKKAAISLTYDDALHAHLDKVVPALNERNLKATFYLSGSFAALKERPMEWAPVAENGHELGNHSLFHPCRGDLPARDWVNPDYDLSRYSVSRMTDEIVVNNVLLNTIDHQTKRTFAYPCGEKEAGGISYMGAVEDYFTGARGVNGRLEKIGQIKLYDIGAFMINGESGEELISLVKQALGEQALVVFLFHGVGGEHDLNVSLEAHNELLDFLKSREDELWIAPMVEIVEYVKKEQG